VHALQKLQPWQLHSRCVGSALASIVAHTREQRRGSHSAATHTGIPWQHDLRQWWRTCFAMTSRSAEATISRSVALKLN
jgi:hypothetical protein